MDWSNERYVRWYVRDTKTWILLGWEGQCVLGLLLRKVDRAGVLEDARDAADLAVFFANGMPVDTIATGLGRLVDKGVVEVREFGVVVPNFIDAQEANQSDKQRTSECRKRRRDLSRLASRKSRDVSVESRDASLESHADTSGHDLSLCAVLCRAVPSQSSCADLPPNPPSGGTLQLTPPEPKARQKRTRGPSPEWTPCPELPEFVATEATLRVAAETGRGWKPAFEEMRLWSRNAPLVHGKGLKRDWNAALQGWMRRSYSQPTTGGRRQEPPQPNDENNRYRPKEWKPPATKGTP